MFGENVLLRFFHTGVRKYYTCKCCLPKCDSSLGQWVERTWAPESKTSNQVLALSLSLCVSFLICKIVTLMRIRYDVCKLLITVPSIRVQTVLNINHSFCYYFIDNAFF